MRISCLVASMLALLVVSTVTPASGWVQRFENENLGNFTSAAVAVDGVGAVVVGGRDGSGASADFSVVKLDGASGAEVWRQALDGTANAYDSVRAISVDAAGDVVAAGVLENTTTSSDFAVVKLDGATGAELWQYTLDGTSATLEDDHALDVLTDAAGDVVAIGNLSKDGVDGLNVVKLDGATGVEVWRNEYPSATWVETAAVAVDGNGDVVVAGTKIEMSDLPLLIAKLDGLTGAELWQRSTGGPDGYAHDVVVDASGDVLVNGRLGNGTYGNFDFVVLRLDGATGADVWQYSTFGMGESNLDVGDVLAVDAAGDVLATGQIRVVLTSGKQQLALVKLDGSLGSQLWRASIQGTDPSLPDMPSGLVVHSSGDVFVAGSLNNENTGDDGVVARFDGSTGAEIWRQAIDGTEESKTQDLGNDRVIALAVHPSGDPIAVGDVAAKSPAHSFMTARLDQDDGALGGFPGLKLLVKDPGDPAKRQITFLIKDDLLQAPAPGSIYDPRVTGGTFRIWNPTTLEEAIFTLPAGAWLPIGTPPGVKGYRYKGATGSGACTKALIRQHKKLSVTCKAKSGSIPFTLDEPSQGSLAVSVQIGDLAPQCAQFGGLVIRDEPGQFKAKAAPGLPTCP